MIGKIIGFLEFILERIVYGVKVRVGVSCFLIVY